VRAKLDENFGTRGLQLLSERGWDVATVAGQELCSVSDPTLIEVCRVEDRALISFDTDFANTLLFPPGRYRGIVVLRLPEPMTLPAIGEALTRVANLAERRSVIGRLWIVSASRIREYVPSEISS
jgi:predicted nuclease of predicted toxin-antitoxin system